MNAENIAKGRRENRWLGLIPNVVFIGIAVLFAADFRSLNHCSVRDVIAVTIAFMGMFNSFFAMSLVFFNIWWFRSRSRLFLILAVVTFAINALLWFAIFAGSDSIGAI